MRRLLHLESINSDIDFLKLIIGAFTLILISFCIKMSDRQHSAAHSPPPPPPPPPHPVLIVLVCGENQMKLFFFIES